MQALTAGSVEALSLAGADGSMSAQEQTRGQAAGRLTRNDGGWVQALTVRSAAALSLAERLAIPWSARDRTYGQAAVGLTRDFEEKTAGSGSTRVIRGVTRWWLKGYNHLHAGGWSFLRLPWSARSGSTAGPTATVLAGWACHCHNYPTLGFRPFYYYARYYHACYYHAHYYYVLRHTLDWLLGVVAAPP